MIGPTFSPFAWTCPFCGKPTTINKDDYSGDKHLLHVTSGQWRWLATHFIICPNPDCKEVSLVVELYNASVQPGLGVRPDEIEKEWTLIPPFRSQVIPEYVPQAIRDDYYEACQIQELSPKAAATLARRAMQGMIRDFWGIRKPRLKDEIDALEEKVDALTWKAIDAVRKVGNIGAHMEQDVNLIIDVDRPEAALLISLVEDLIKDWYVARYDREERLRKAIEIGKIKEESRLNQSKTTET